MSRSWAGGSSRRWRKIRAAVLATNEHENTGRCTLAIPGVCTGPATQVHHTKGKAYGDYISDLVAVCQACNLHVGQPQRTSPHPDTWSTW